MLESRIRKANTTKLAIRSLLKDMQLETLPSDTVYDVTKGHWWILYVDYEPAGYCGLVPSKQWQDTGYFCRAGIREAYRVHGLQRKLIKTRIRKARELGYNWLITDTNDNPASANNLIACGFRMITPSKPWCESEAACYWALKLR